MFVNTKCIMYVCEYKMYVYDGSFQDENCRRVVSVPNAFYGAGATETPVEANYRKRPFSSYNIQVNTGCATESVTFLRNDTKYYRYYRYM